MNESINCFKVSVGWKFKCIVCIDKCIVKRKKERGDCLLVYLVVKEVMVC